MKYTWDFKKVFATQFSNWSKKDQDKILDFTDIYEEYGLDDFSKYPGKIAPSWSFLDISDPNYSYTTNNYLWHYHVGIPEYRQVHDKFQTSSYVLHFQWKNKGTHISLVDCYEHYLKNGTFYLPPEQYLELVTKMR